MCIALATPNAQQEHIAVPGLWNLSGDVVFQPGHGASRHHDVVSMAWSDDGELLATGGSDPQTIIWNKDGTQRQVLPTGGWVSSLGFEPKSHRLAVGTQNGEIHLWDLETKTSKKLSSPHTAWVTLRWSSDGMQIASAGYDGKLSLWNAESGAAKQTITKDRDGNALGNVHSVDISLDGKYLAAGSLDRVWIFHAEDGKQVHSLQVGGWTYAARFSPDSKRLAAGSSDGKLRVWSVTDGKVEFELPHAQMVAGVDWSTNGRFLACSTAQRITVYKADGSKQLDLMPLGMTNGLVMSPSGHMRTGHTDRLIYVLQTESGQVMANVQEMESRWGWKNDARLAEISE